MRNMNVSDNSAERYIPLLMSESTKQYPEVQRLLQYPEVQKVFFDPDHARTAEARYAPYVRELFGFFDGILAKSAPPSTEPKARSAKLNAPFAEPETQSFELNAQEVLNDPRVRKLMEDDERRSRRRIGGIVMLIGVLLMAAGIVLTMILREKASDFMFAVTAVMSLGFMMIPAGLLILISRKNVE